MNKVVTGLSYNGIEKSLHVSYVEGKRDKYTGNEALSKFNKLIEEQVYSEIMEGQKVIAMESFKNGHLRLFGEGVKTDRVPDIEAFKNIKLKNPCIKLDNGKHVWGFECWWGEKEAFEKKYGEHIKTTEIVEIENEILPVEELL